MRVVLALQTFSREFHQWRVPHIRPLRTWRLEGRKRRRLIKSSQRIKIESTRIGNRSPPIWAYEKLIRTRNGPNLPRHPTHCQQFRRIFADISGIHFRSRLPASFRAGSNEETAAQNRLTRRNSRRNDGQQRSSSTNTGLSRRLAGVLRQAVGAVDLLHQSNSSRSAKSECQDWEAQRPENVGVSRGELDSDWARGERAPSVWSSGAGCQLVARHLALVVPPCLVRGREEPKSR